MVSRYTNEEDFPALLAGLVRDKAKLRAWLGDRDAAGVDAAVKASLGLPPDTDRAALLAEGCAPDAARDDALRRAAGAMVGGSKTDQKHGALILAWLDAADRTTAFDAYQEAFFTKQGDRRKDLIHKQALAVAPDADDVLAREADRLAVVRDRLNALGVAEATVALLLLARAVIARFETLKAERALLDYDDLIARTLGLLRRAQAGAVAWVLYKLDGGIDHLLVDEAQDTSPPQWALIELLTEEFFAGEGGGRGDARTVFVVGDVKQSIYSFQGASPQSFGAMRADFEARAEAVARAFERIELHVSYRSTETVLEAVDLVFADAEARDGLGEPDETISHTAQRKGQAGRVEVWPLTFHEDADPDEPWSLPRIRAASVHPRLRLARKIAATVKGWLDGEERLAARDRPIRPGDVMILVRRRNELVDEVVTALKRAHVPVAGVDRMKLGEQLAVKDLVALGRFLLLPEDDLTLAAVLKGPLVGLDDDALFRLAFGRERMPLWRRLVAGAETDAVFGAAHDFLAGLLAQADFRPPYELFGEVLEAHGGRHKMVARLGHEAEDPIDEFLTLALAYQRRHTPSLEGFLHWFEAGETEVKRDLEQDVRDEVRVMTVHGAKGLEAPIVFLPDTTVVPSTIDPVLWPDAPADAADGPPLWVPRRALAPAAAEPRYAAARERAAAEYRRLLYVALTRAADRLYVCGWANKRGRDTGCWYDLVTRSMPDAAQQEMDFGGGWQGTGWVIEAGGASETPEAAPAAPEKEVPLPDWARRPPAPEPAPPDPLAPSRPSEDEPPVRSPLAPDDTHRFRRGLLIHRLLETLPDLPAAARAAAAARFLANPAHGLSDDEQAAIRAETLAVIDDPATGFLFGPDSLAEVPVCGRLGTRVVSGQIDRLAVLDSSVWIVDYKTNRPPPEREEGVAPLYFRQMAAYRALISAIYPDKSVVCALLWTDALRLMRLSDGNLDTYAPPAADNAAA